MLIRKFTAFAAMALVAGAASAQSSSITDARSASDAGAIAQTGNITFESAQQRKNTSVDTTPNVYTAPSMFGAGTCGQSDTFGVSVTGFGIGGSAASDDPYCNARQDTGTAWNLGYKDVAAMRFFCFGASDNRMAWEATGRTCPQGSTAQGLREAERQRTMAATHNETRILP